MIDLERDGDDYLGIHLYGCDIEAFRTLVEEADHYPIAVRLRGMLRD